MTRLLKTREGPVDLRSAKQVSMRSIANRPGGRPKFEPSFAGGEAAQPERLGDVARSQI